MFFSSASHIFLSFCGSPNRIFYTLTSCPVFGEHYKLLNAGSGALAAHYEYDPFGNTLVAGGAEAQNNVFRFSTKFTDAESGLLYYGYRYYAPGLGRWLNRDPIWEKGGLNLYGLVRNNPINTVDTNGLATFPQLLNFNNGNNPLNDVTGEIERKLEPYKPNHHGVGILPNNYIGGEMQAIIGYGITRISCCDENNNKQIMFFSKQCIGVAAGLGIGNGMIRGMNGERCKPKYYKGWFLELGISIGPITAGVDFGFNEHPSMKIPILNLPHPAPEPTGINEGGVGLGWGFCAKTSWCYYNLKAKQTKICGCN